MTRPTDELLDQESWSEWARTQGWKGLQFEEHGHGERAPGVWVCIGTGMSITSPAHPYAVAAPSREAATAIAVDLALDHLATSPTDEYVRQQMRLRAEWEGLQELDRAGLPAEPDVLSVKDLLAVTSTKILDLANVDGAGLSVTFAWFDLADLPGVSEPPRTAAAAREIRRWQKKQGKLTGK